MGGWGECERRGDADGCWCCCWGHWGRGQDICGPRVPRWLAGPPNMGERSGVERFDGELRPAAGDDWP